MSKARRLFLPYHGSKTQRQFYRFLWHFICDAIDIKKAKNYYVYFTVTYKNIQAQVKSEIPSFKQVGEKPWKIRIILEIVQINVFLIILSL